MIKARSNAAKTQQSTAEAQNKTAAKARMRNA